MVKKIRLDLEQYDARFNNTFRWYNQVGFWVTAIYRLGSWARTLSFKPASFILRILVSVLMLPFRMFIQVVIPSSMDCGSGLVIVHPYMIIFAAKMKIGKYCTVHHEVTFGTGPIKGVPEIGDNVTVYCGARILGGVKVGDNATIGANTVVVKDVAPGATVMPPRCQHLPAETMA